MKISKMKREWNENASNNIPRNSSYDNDGIKKIKIFHNDSTDLAIKMKDVKSLNEVEDSKSFSNQNGSLYEESISNNNIQVIFQKHKVAMEFYQVALSKFESISNNLRALPDIFDKQSVAMEFSEVSLLKFQSIADDLKNIMKENAQVPISSTKVKIDLINLDSEEEEDFKGIIFGDDVKIIEENLEAKLPEIKNLFSGNTHNEGLMESEIKIENVAVGSRGHLQDRDSGISTLIDVSGVEKKAQNCDRVEILELIQLSEDEVDSISDLLNIDNTDDQKDGQNVEQNMDEKHRKIEKENYNLSHQEEKERQINDENITSKKLKQTISSLPKNIKINKEINFDKVIKKGSTNESVINQKDYENYENNDLKEDQNEDSTHQTIHETDVQNNNSNIIHQEMYGTDLSNIKSREEINDKNAHHQMNFKAEAQNNNSNTIQEDLDNTLQEKCKNKKTISEPYIEHDISNLNLQTELQNGSHHKEQKLKNEETLISLKNVQLNRDKNKNNLMKTILKKGSSLNPQVVLSRDVLKEYMEKRIKIKMDTDQDVISSSNQLINSTIREMSDLSPKPLAKMTSDGKLRTKKFSNPENGLHISDAISSSNQLINSTIREMSDQSPKPLAKKTSDGKLRTKKFSNPENGLHISDDDLKIFCEKYKEQLKENESFSISKFPCPLCQKDPRKVQMQLTQHLQTQHFLSDVEIEILLTKVKIFIEPVKRFEMGNGGHKITDSVSEHDKKCHSALLVDEHNNKISLNEEHEILLKEFGNYRELTSNYRELTSGIKERGIFLDKLRKILKFVENFHFSYRNIFKNRKICLDIVNIIKKYFEENPSNFKPATLRMYFSNLRLLTAFIFEANKQNSIDLYNLVKFNFGEIRKYLNSMEKIVRTNDFDSVEDKMLTRENLNKIYNHPYYIESEELLMRSPPLRKNLVRVRNFLTFAILTRNLEIGENVVHMQLRDALEPKFNKETKTYYVRIYCRTKQILEEAQLLMSELIYFMLKRYIEDFRMFVPPSRDAFKDLVFLSIKGIPLSYTILQSQHINLVNRCGLESFKNNSLFTSTPMEGQKVIYEKNIYTVSSTDNLKNLEDEISLQKKQNGTQP